MKLKILLVIETLVLIFFIVLANIKAGEAMKATLRSEKLAEEAVKNRKDALRMADFAEKAAADYVEMESRLKACESNK